MKLLIAAALAATLCCSKAEPDPGPAPSPPVEAAPAAPAPPDAAVASAECQQACKHVVEASVAEVESKRELNLAMGISPKVIDDTRRGFEQSGPRCLDSCARGLAAPACLMAGTTWKDFVGCGL